MERINIKIIRSGISVKDTTLDPVLNDIEVNTQNIKLIVS